MGGDDKIRNCTYAVARQTSPFPLEPSMPRECCTTRNPNKNAGLGQHDRPGAINVNYSG